MNIGLQKSIEKDLEQMLASIPVSFAGFKLYFDDRHGRIDSGNRNNKTSEDKKAHVLTQNGRVELYLLEPLTDEHLQQWQSAMLEADSAILENVRQRDWQKTNPKFFERIKAKFNR